jgi:NitT/TauT family transport system substrate-binding protein
MPFEHISRKALLKGAASGAGALALSGIVHPTPALAFNVVGLARPKVRLGWFGASCEAPLYAAYETGIFDRAGVDVELVKLSKDYTSVDGIGAGKLDGAPGILHAWLKPIEQGVDAKIAAGLHGGCLRLVAATKSGIKTLADLKGKSIATDQLGGSAMSFFSVLISKQGLDPTKDVSWRAYPPDQLETALDKGEAQVVAASDPFAYALIPKHKAVEIGSNMSGLFADVSGLSHNHFCCVVALRGGLVRDDPKTAATVTRAWLDGSRYVGRHIQQIAELEIDKKYVASDVPTIANLLGSYEWHPSADLVYEDIQLGAHDFLKAGILDKRTDPDALAKKAYVDIFREVARA